MAVLTMGNMPRQTLYLAGYVVLVLGFSGCDYWPPALQVQIEQLRSEIQTVTMDNTQLQSQVDALSRTNQDLETQVNELKRVVQRKSDMIANLQHQVGTVHVKTVKTSRVSQKAAAPSRKYTTQQAMKKKRAAKQPR